MTMPVDKSVNNFLEKGLFLTYNTARCKLEDALNVAILQYEFA